MRHFRTFTVISFLTLALGGCKMESAGSSAFNPAANVNFPLDTLMLKDIQGLDPVLKYTVFHDLYRGIQPLTAGDDSGFAAQLRAHLDPFIGATPNGDGTDYVSVRNPVDLMGEMIRSGRVTNFNDGRRLMVNSISEGKAARYNTPANNVQTRFFEEVGDDSTPPEDKAWVYPMLDWTYNPSANRVFRATLFVATPPQPPETASTELASATWSGRFPATTFRASGFNQPEYAATSLTGRTKGNIELLQYFVGSQKDELTLTGVSGITIGGTEPDCIKAVLHYDNAEQRLQVFTSKDEPANVEENGANVANATYCGNKQNGEETLNYLTIAIPERQ
jgi:hypothetical protein